MRDPNQPVPLAAIEAAARADGNVGLLALCRALRIAVEALEDVRTAALSPQESARRALEKVARLVVIDFEVRSLLRTEAGGALTQVVKLRCPRCGVWGDLDQDQLHGRVSTRCPTVGCSFHERVDFSRWVA